MVTRVHLFPFRTQQLSSFTVTILGWRRPGKITQRLHLKQQRKLLLFLLRVDTYGFYPLSSHFPLLLSLAQTRNQRSLRKGERQRIFSTVGEHSVLPFLDLFAVSDSLLLYMRLSLRRRNIPVSRELFTGAGGWGLSGKAHTWTQMDFR